MGRRPEGPPARPFRPARPIRPIRGEALPADTELPRGDSHAAAAPSELIWGRHAALAALESERPIHRIWCTPEMRFRPTFLQLLREAKASGVLVEEVTWARLGQISGGAVHQGIVLQPAAADTLDLPSLIDGCRKLGEAPLLVAVDGLTDPQNLGAILRSAEALGVHGLVLPQRRNAGLTGSVAKVAAGALEHLPVARVVNLNRSLETLRQEGYRVVGLDPQGSVSLEEADLEGPLVVITGSEGQGLSVLTRRSCDQLVRIPLRGSTPSLNASVATALVLYEVARRGWMRGLRGMAKPPRLVRPNVPTEAPQSDAVALPFTTPPPVATAQPVSSNGTSAAGASAAARMAETPLRQTPLKDIRPEESALGETAPAAAVPAGPAPLGTAPLGTAPAETATAPLASLPTATATTEAEVTPVTHPAEVGTEKVAVSALPLGTTMEPVAPAFMAPLESAPLELDPLESATPENLPRAGAALPPPPVAEGEPASEPLPEPLGEPTPSEATAEQPPTQPPSPPAETPAEWPADANFANDIHL